MTLADLFPEEDYQFKFRFERGNVSEFFRPTAQHDQLIALRRVCLDKSPSTYAALLPEGIPLLQESISLARSEQTLSEGDSSGLPHDASPWQQCLDLGTAW